MAQASPVLDEEQQHSKVDVGREENPDGDAREPIRCRPLDGAGPPRATPSNHASDPERSGPHLYDEVLHAGWGEPHPISGTMLVCGPRDEVELEVVWRLVCASHHWATATEAKEAGTWEPPLGWRPRAVHVGSRPARFALHLEPRAGIAL